MVCIHNRESDRCCQPHTRHPKIRRCSHSLHRTRPSRWGRWGLAIAGKSQGPRAASSSVSGMLLHGRLRWKRFRTGRGTGGGHPDWKKVIGSPAHKSHRSTSARGEEGGGFWRVTAVYGADGAGRGGRGVEICCCCCPCRTIRSASSPWQSRLREGLGGGSWLTVAALSTRDHLPLQRGHVTRCEEGWHPDVKVRLGRQVITSTVHCQSAVR